MSNHLAIATVTAALGTLAHGAAKGAVPGTKLRFGRPQAPAADLHQVNVFLYQAQPHAPTRNDDLAQRDAAGRLVRRPVASLALHYLLSFYGEEASFEPERMLGAVLRDLHARPVLVPAAIANAVSSWTVLGESNLAEGPARVKFTPLAMNLEKVSRLWSVMIQTPFVLSTAWQAEIVQIEALDPVEAPAPVLRRGADDRGPEAGAALPPTIDRLWFGLAGSEELQPWPSSIGAALLGGVVRIGGARFAGDDVRVELIAGGPAPLALAATREAEGVLRCAIPDDAATAAALAAGAAALRVAVTRAGETMRSDVAPLLLAPRVTGLAPDPLPAVGTSLLTVACLPAVRPGQRVVLRLGALELAAEPIALATQAPRFAVSGAAVSDGVLAVLSVDGVASQPVRHDAASGGFVFDDAQRVRVA